MESYLTSAIRWQLTGIGRWARNDLALQNVGVSLQDYSVFTVPNPGGAASGPNAGATDPIPVYDRLPSSFGRDRYLLTNSPLERARYLGVDLNLRITTGRLWIMAGGTAQLTEAHAAYRGFRAIENDQGVIGDLLADPNSTTFAYRPPIPGPRFHRKDHAPVELAQGHPDRRAHSLPGRPTLLRTNGYSRTGSGQRHRPGVRERWHPLHLCRHGRYTLSERVRTSAAAALTRSSTCTIFRTFRNQWKNTRSPDPDPVRRQPSSRR